ncbi:ryncolin-1-like [Musca autumnalis]|uniref:ryncolin-1-like n=1 Tax=Musca autumnalis TaxID=221902 RepID=UPI003CFB4653
MKNSYLIIWIFCCGCIVCEAVTKRESRSSSQSTQEKLDRLLQKTSAMHDHIKKLENKIDELHKASNAQLAKMAELEVGNWLTIQRRQDGSLDFYRNWTDYQMGFGNSTDAEFFVGLEKVHNLTSATPHELLIILKDWINDTRYAHYSDFKIAGENEKYAITSLGYYSGNAGDGMEYYLGQQFSTFDNDNDDDVETNCAELYKSAWWFKSCSLSDLNGQYQDEKYATEDGVTWYTWKGLNYSLKFAEMKIKPKRG